MSGARDLWARVETVHAVTYFAPESVEAARLAGLRGYWMGYFGFRAAPLGPVPAAVVEAVFAGFAARMVARAVPDAWGYARPEVLVDRRAQAAADALRRLVPQAEQVATEAVPLLERIVSASSPLGRPLFAANAALPPIDDPVARWWQLCTSLREHRGDGHVMALVRADLDGCEAQLLHAAEHGTPHAVLRDNRGWTTDEWQEAEARLVVRGLVGDGGLTSAGQAIRAHIEEETDRLGPAPRRAGLSDEEARHLLDLMVAPVRAVAFADVIPYPNPMGLPRPDRD